MSLIASDFTDGPGGDQGVVRGGETRPGVCSASLMDHFHASQATFSNITRTSITPSLVPILTWDMNNNDQCWSVLTQPPLSLSDHAAKDSIVQQPSLGQFQIWLPAMAENDHSAD
jgi:hypothetical protein